LYEYPELGGDRVAVGGAAEFADGSVFEEALIAGGGFRCGARCVFRRPVYIGGDGEVGRGSRLCAVAAEGELTLGPGARVEQWAESGGALELRSRCEVGGEAISGAAIRLGMEARAGSLFAPEVSTHGRTADLGEAAPVSSYLEIRPPACGRMPDLSVAAGWRAEKMRALGGETWLYEGHLHLPMPVLLRAKLVVRGSFRCPAGSLLEDDVKAGGTLEVGPASVCRGNLTAHGELTLAEDCLFEGELRGAGLVRLSSGTRGFREHGPVLVTAGRALVLEPDVMVRGRLMSAGAGVSVAAPEAPGLALLLAEA
jgi:hypothetical protein